MLPLGSIYIMYDIIDMIDEHKVKYIDLSQ